MKCELCRSKTRRPHLCEPCSDMLRRLMEVWKQLGLVERGRLIYQGLEREKEAAQARAKGAGRE